MTGMKGIGRQSFLIVFDFDHTLVDCNSDVVIPQALGRGELLDTLTASREMQWTRLVDTLIAPFTAKEIATAAQQGIVIDPNMPAVFDYLRSLQKEYNYSDKVAVRTEKAVERYPVTRSRSATAQGSISTKSSDSCGSSVSTPHESDESACATAAHTNRREHGKHKNAYLHHLEETVPGMFEVDIVSDANTLFIEAALAAHLPAAQAAVSQIHSNPYYCVAPVRHDADAPTVKQQQQPSEHASARTCYVRRNTCAEDECERDAAYNAGTTRRSRIGWYEPAGHDCPFCNTFANPGMCKSRILQRILATTHLIDPTIIYIGDGLNDYCPVMNVLRPRDHVLVRHGMTLHRMLAGMIPLVGNKRSHCPQHSPLGHRRCQDQQPCHYQSNAGGANCCNCSTRSSCDPSCATAESACLAVGGCCSVGLWSNALELLSLLRALCGDWQSTSPSSAVSIPAVPRLPTLVRMRDAGPLEFRSITMSKRIPAVLRRTFDQNKHATEAATAAATDDSAHNMNNATISDENTDAIVDKTGTRAASVLQRLMMGAMKNGVVPRLPGQAVLPACWRNYAYTTEFDQCAPHPCHRVMCVPSHANSNPSSGASECDHYQCVTPRWGQLPWLHGEIYFYHLLWQYLQWQNQEQHERTHASRIAHANAASQTDEVPLAPSHGNAPVEPNLISIYSTLNPLYSWDCQVAMVHQKQDKTQLRAARCHVPYQWQTCDTFLAHDEPQTYADGVVVYGSARTSSEQGHTSNDSDEKDLSAGDGAERSRRIAYTDVADAARSYLVPAPTADATDKSNLFLPYRDIFAHEKESLLRNFIDMRVVPMLACEPWAAGTDFAPVLLRWCLWANGLDLSMFTLDQLSAMHSSEAPESGEVHHGAESNGAREDTMSRKEGNNDTGRDTNEAENGAVATDGATVRRLRAVERSATMRQDAMLVGDCAAGAAQHLQRLIERAQRYRAQTASIHATRGAGDGASDQRTGNATIEQEETGQSRLGGSSRHAEQRPSMTDFVNRIDIVMDNVGVECVADLCLGLWFIEQAAHPTVPPCVTYHVKSMPYYVSDVTPRDIDATLATLEQLYATEKNSSPDDKGEEEDEEQNDVSENRQTTRTRNENAKESETERQAMLRRIVSPFVARVRAAFKLGAFQLDADAVWTQPSEFRELPPRILNQYFYTQCVTPPNDSPPTSSLRTPDGVWAHIDQSVRPACAVYRANKCGIRAYSALVIFKGDLNYRRLIGDRYWNRTDFLSTLTDSTDLRHIAAELRAGQRTIVDELLQDTPASAVMDSPSFDEVVSSFWPTHVVPVCAIRTIKSECCVGVPGDTKGRLDLTMGKQWRLTGKYGEILFAGAS